MNDFLWCAAAGALVTVIAYYLGIATGRKEQHIKHEIEEIKLTRARLRRS